MAGWRKKIDKDGPSRLSEEDYSRDLLSDPKKSKAAFERAWVTRNFEIELYWKRAAYFWTLNAAVLTGFFAVSGKISTSATGQGHDLRSLILMSLGVVLAFGWHLTNKGSKGWQRHWEIHIDLLENEFTGPLYKTVHQRRTYSVSKINQTLSGTMVICWVLLSAAYISQSGLCVVGLGATNFRLVETLILLLTITSVANMYIGTGQGRFKDRIVRMYRRGVKYDPNHHQ